MGAGSKNLRGIEMSEEKDDHSKYKMFRNFMVNELGISKDDIKDWTMRSVSKTVDSTLSGMDLEKLMNAAIEREARKLVGGSGYNTTATAEKLRSELAKKLAETLTIKISDSAFIVEVEKEA
jgi:hypothetical protein